MTAVLSLLMVGLFLGGNPLPGGAADWSITPQMTVEGQYDSNVNFAFVRQRSDFILKMVPTVDLAYASDVSKLTGRLGLSGLVYLRDGRWNALNQFYTIMGQRRLAPRLSLTFDLGFTVDSTLAEELTASGAIINRSLRYSFRGGPGLTYALSERASLKLGYAYSQTIYQDPDFSGYSQHQANLGLNYLLKNAKTTLSGTIQGRLVNYPDIDNFSRILGTHVGLEHVFTEDWSASCSGGLNYSWFSSQTAVSDTAFTLYPIQTSQPRMETFTVRPYFSLEGRRRWPRANLKFGYRVDQSPSAFGTIQQYHGFFAGFNYNFRERLTGNLQTGFSYSTSSSPGADYQNFVCSLSPGLTYRITERWSVSAGYRFNWRKDLVTEQTADRHLFNANLNFSYPLHLQK